MIDPTNVPDVAPNEVLARFVLQNSHIRRSTGTVKPDAFIPNSNGELSVTRHREATNAEIWNLGADVAAATEKTLHGRADVQAAVCLMQKLTVIAVPVPGNPNHADIANWPMEKPLQKVIAQEIAAKSLFVPRPEQAE